MVALLTMSFSFTFWCWYLSESVETEPEGRVLSLEPVRRVLTRGPVAGRVLSRGPVKLTLFRVPGDSWGWDAWVWGRARGRVRVRGRERVRRLGSGLTLVFLGSSTAWTRAAVLSSLLQLSGVSSSLSEASSLLVGVMLVVTSHNGWQFSTLEVRCTV